MCRILFQMLFCVFVSVYVCVCRWTVRRAQESRREQRSWRTCSDSTLEWLVLQNNQEHFTYHLCYFLLAVRDCHCTVWTGTQEVRSNVPHVVECVSVSMWPGTRWPSQRCWGATWMPWWWTLKRLAKTASSTSRSRYVYITSCRKSSVKAWY